MSNTSLTFELLFVDNIYNDYMDEINAFLDHTLQAHDLERNAPVDIHILCDAIWTHYQNPSTFDYWTFCFIRTNILGQLQTHNIEIPTQYWALFCPYTHEEAIEISSLIQVPKPPKMHLGIQYENEIGRCNDLDKYFEDWTYALCDACCGSHYNHEDFPEDIENGPREVQTMPTYHGEGTFYIFGWGTVIQHHYGVQVLDKSASIYSWDHEDENLFKEHSFGVLPFLRQLTVKGNPSETPTHVFLKTGSTT